MSSCMNSVHLWLACQFQVCCVHYDVCISLRLACLFQLCHVMYELSTCSLMRAATTLMENMMLLPSPSTSGTTSCLLSWSSHRKWVQLLSLLFHQVIVGSPRQSQKWQCKVHRCSHKIKQTNEGLDFYRCSHKIKQTNEGLDFYNHSNFRTAIIEKRESIQLIFSFFHYFY